MRPSLNRHKKKQSPDNVRFRRTLERNADSPARTNSLQDFCVRETLVREAPERRELPEGYTIGPHVRVPSEQAFLEGLGGHPANWKHP